MLRADPDVFIVALDKELQEAGLELYRRRPDKDWSLTDCISFVVMQREGAAATLEHRVDQLWPSDDVEEQLYVVFVVYYS